MDITSKYTPIEVTTHNIYFHEDSPILSLDIQDNYLATCGFDNVIRIWKINCDKMKYKENTYKTAANSSISIEYSHELHGFNRPINCVRYWKSINSNKKGIKVLAACSDGGKIIIFLNTDSFVVRNDDGDDAYDLAWHNDSLIVGFSSRRVEIYKIEISSVSLSENDQINSNKETDQNNHNSYSDENIKICCKIQSKLLLNQKIHNGTIQGISVSNNLLATHSIDKTVKLHQIHSDYLQLVTIFDKKIDNSRGLFKRVLLTETEIYVFIKSNIINVFSYPFREVHLQKKIGTLNAPPIKIIKNGSMYFICTKKSAYIFDNDKLICCIDNCCYMAVTDAILYNNNILFISSMDGFITTIRLNIEECRKCDDLQAN